MANDSNVWDSPDYFTWTSILFSQRPSHKPLEEIGSNHDTAQSNDMLYDDSLDYGSSTTTIGYENSTEIPDNTGFTSSLAEFALNATTVIADENQTLYYQVKTNSTSVLRTSDNDTDAKAAIESGSNFMLLFEDFGEYFYNYNGTGFNESSISQIPFNCSVNNGTCPSTTESKY